jgi:UDP-N-acetylglucosamine transferase subunit ALG13
VSTFVSVGNATQPFLRLLESVCAAAPGLPQPVFVQYGAAHDFRCDSCEGADYISMEEFSLHVAQASLLLLHGGAGSVLNAVRAGKVPVVMPRQAARGEHVDDHQQEFVRELAAMGKVVLCDDPAQLMFYATQALALQAKSRSIHSEPLLVGEIRQLLQSHAATLQHKQEP